MRTRRRWWQHCSALALAGMLGLAGAAAGPTKARAPLHPVLLVLGDSLSAEYGLVRGTGWVSLLEQRLRAEKIEANVVNASISGDTTSGGRSRLGALLALHHPSHVLIELGGNDALRGLPLAMTHDNLSAMTQAAQASGAKVMLLGMQVPPNYGARYSSDFSTLFATVAKAHQAAVLPFLLAGVADAPNADTWFQQDRIHPLAKAHPLILNNVWTLLRPWLK